jgi:D-3-phosphoglycerate dehydrogenase
MQIKYRILITSTSFGKTDPLPLQNLQAHGCEVIKNPYGRPLKEDELISLLADVDGVIAGLDEFTPKAIQSAKRLKVISRYGVGMDNIDLEAARAKKIRVTSTPGANTQAVADLTIALMLAVARKITRADISTRQGKWERFYGHSLYRKTLGILGLGRVGQAVFRRSAGFEMKALAYDPWQKELIEKTDGIKYADLQDLLSYSDFVTLHLALSEKTHHLIGEKELSLMRPTAYLINTARGSLINEEALYQALKNKVIAGAALDTFTDEPPRASPLLTLENVVVTPHIGSYTYEATLEMGLAAVENLISSLEGSGS